MLCIKHSIFIIIQAKKERVWGVYHKAGKRIIYIGDAFLLFNLQLKNLVYAVIVKKDCRDIIKAQDRRRLEIRR